MGGAARESLKGRGKMLAGGKPKIKGEGCHADIAMPEHLLGRFDSGVKQVLMGR